MLSKLEIAKLIRKVDDAYTPIYQCNAVYGSCLVCPFSSYVSTSEAICITGALQYLEQHEKKLQQWKNINAK